MGVRGEEIFGLEFLGGHTIELSGETWKSPAIFAYCSQRLLHMQMVSVPWEADQDPLPTGKKHVAVFGSTEGESSDDSLVDLVSAGDPLTAASP